MEWIIWPVLLALILLFEGKALWSQRINDTLSESVWWLRTRLWGRALLFPLWAWLTWHFFLEPTSLDPRAGVWYDDGITVVVGLVLAVFRDYDDYHKTKVKE